jgi:hypothetical protein
LDTKFEPDAEARELFHRFLIFNEVSQSRFKDGDYVSLKARDAWLSFKIGYKVALGWKPEIKKPEIQ